MNACNRIRLLTLAGVIVTLAACAPPQPKKEDVQAAITAGNKVFSESVAKGDGAGVASVFAADAMAMPAGMDAVTGNDAIRAFWQKSIDDGVRELKTETVSLDVGGPIAVETGTYVLTGANGAHLDHGKYLTLWKQENGGWKISRDIWTTSMAPAAPPPAETAPPAGAAAPPAPFSS